MALICDTGAVYAMHDADDAHHESVKTVVLAEPGQDPKRIAQSLAQWAESLIR